MTNNGQTPGGNTTTAGAVERHVKISAEDLSKGLCSMTCPQCLAIPSTNGLCPLCSDSGWVVRTVEEAATMNVPLRWGQIDKKASKDTGDEGEDGHAIGVRDGFEEAVQLIDTLTGGDGEYRFCTNGDPERHCPTPVEMIANIVERFQAHSLPGDVGMREAAEEIASIITPGNFWHARTIGDLTGWCGRLQTRIRALAALTPSALSGDALTEILAGAISDERIAEIEKIAAYKYFGDYEMSEVQLDATLDAVYALATIRKLRAALPSHQGAGE